MAEQLAGEGLAKAHDFTGALALGIEVRTALGTAHGQRGQRVLQGLLERQEFQDGQVHRGVEAQAALVGADRQAVLDAVAAVDLDLAPVVGPAHPEYDGALGLHQPFQQALFSVARVLGNEGPQALHDLGHGLDVFGLARVALGDMGHEGMAIGVLHEVMSKRNEKGRHSRACAPPFRISALKRCFFCAKSVHGEPVGAGRARGEVMQVGQRHG